MSGWGRDYDDDPALSLSDIERGLEGEDRATFAALLMKGMAAIEGADTIAELRGELERQQRYAASAAAQADKVRVALQEARLRIKALEGTIMDKDGVLTAADEQKARALVSENRQLRERVEIQRQIIGRFERSATASPWQMFKDGLSSVFADPLTAVATAKAD